MLIDGKQMHEFDGTRVKIMVTSKCTTACKHCCLGFAGTKDIAEVWNIIEQLKDKYEIRLDGSELLLDDEYIRMMKSIGQDNVLTNGRLIVQDPQRYIRLLQENDIGDIYFSYHYGIQEELNDVPLLVVDEAIKIMKNAGFRIALMATVTKKNKHLLEKIVQIAIDYGAFFIQINPIVLQGRARTYMQNDVLDDAERQNLCVELERLKEKYGDIIEIDPGKAFEFGLGKDFYCRAVTKKIWIGIDNKVYPCIYLIEPGMEIGVYRDGKVWVEDNVKWGGRRCAAYLYCNKNCSLWQRKRV